MRLFFQVRRCRWRRPHRPDWADSLPFDAHGRISLKAECVRHPRLLWSIRRTRKTKPVFMATHGPRQLASLAARRAAMGSLLDRGCPVDARSCSARCEAAASCHARAKGESTCAKYSGANGSTRWTAPTRRGRATGSADGSRPILASWTRRRRPRSSSIGWGGSRSRGYLGPLCTGGRSLRRLGLGHCSGARPEYLRHLHYCLY